MRGFHVFHVCFSCAKLFFVAAFACFVWAKHSGLDVRLCENQCVRLQLSCALYWPSTRVLESNLNSTISEPRLEIVIF